MTGPWSSVLTTAADIYEPDNAVGLLGLLIIGLPASLPAIAALVVVLRGQRKGRQRRDQDRAVLDVVRDNVQNGHPDPLRADLDRQFASLHTRLDEQGRDIRGIRTDVGGIRGDAREDRTNLADLERRVQIFVKREHPGAGPV